MRSKRVVICEFSKGMFKSSGFGNRMMPAEMINLDLNDEARPVLRKGYETTGLLADGNGSRLYVGHWIGDRNNSPRTRFYRFEDGVSWVNTGRRLLVAEANNPRWIDLKTGDSYDWDMTSPGLSPDLALDLPGSGIVPTGVASIYNKISNIEIEPFPIILDSARVKLVVAQEARFRLAVYIQQGQIVKTLADHTQTPLGPGEYEFTWDGTNDQGEDVAIGGGYFISLTDENDNLIRIQRAANLGDTLPGASRKETAEAFVGEIPESSSVPFDYGELTPGLGFRGGWYNVCFTYANPEFGIETAPSPMTQIHVIAFDNINVRPSDPDSQGRSPVRLEVGMRTHDIPDWADRVNIYAGRMWVPPNTALHPKDIQLDFTHIGGMARENLVEGDVTNYYWINERIERPRTHLLSKEWKTEPDLDRLEHITAHAGRVWGYDDTEHVVRFNLIDQRGVSNFDVFPYEDSPLPHAVKFLDNFQSTVQHIEPIPPKGGLYVFFRESIRTIVGQSLIQGLQSAEIAPATDLDASGGINGVGTISPRACIPFENYIIFLGSDRTLYQLSGMAFGSMQNIGQAIQEYLDDATEQEIRNAYAFEYLDKYHLYLGSQLFVLDTRWKYWTIYDFADDMADVFWSHGGGDDESQLYALKGGNIVKLYTGDTDDIADIEWKIVSAWQQVAANTRLAYIYVMHDDNDVEVDIRVEADGRGIIDTNHTFAKYNFYRLGVSSGYIQDRFRVELSGTGSPPQIRGIEAELL